MQSPNFYKFIDENGEHLHTGEGRPLDGTTSIINEMYPPPLAWWATGKALERIGWRNPKKCSKEEIMEAAIAGKTELASLLNMSPDEYVKALNEMYSAHDKSKNESGKEGKAKHALIEKYVKSEMGVWNYTDDPDHPDDHYFEDIKSFVEWSGKNVKRFLWSEAHCFSRDLWVGGIADFGFEHNNGMIFIGDAKPDFYPKHFIQTGGYSRQIKDEKGLYDKDGNKILSFPDQVPRIDGYMIWSYKKGAPKYLTGEWVEKMEKKFEFTVQNYRERKVIGSDTI